MTVEFSRWYLLQDVGEHAPAEPGMYQIRVRDGLLRYPHGQSAMVHYGQADDVRASLLAIAAERPGHDFLCRHHCGASAAVAPDITELSLRFRRRFGIEPTWPERLGARP